MKQIYFLLLFSFLTISIFSQTTAIPDAVFEQKLIDLGIDSNGLNGNILNSDAATVTELHISTSGITDLTGIEAFTNLTWLIAGFNPMRSLDLSSNPLLTKISITGMGLHTLNLTNINVFNLNYLYDNSNPNLLYTCVDNAAWWETLHPSDSASQYTQDCSLLQQTFVPNDIFEQALIDLGYDSAPLNNFVYTPNIAGVTTLDISNKAIQSIEGIEGFTSLTTLNCSNTSLNGISEFDSGTPINTTITSLTYNNNQINNSSIDLAALVNLKTLNWNNNTITSSASPSIYINQLVSLENFTYNNNHFSNTPITSVTLHAGVLVNLKNISCIDSEIDALELPISLETLDCSNNNLIVLTLNNLNSIKTINCSYNNIISINSNGLSNLEYLEASFNQITSTLNLSLSNNLSYLNCNSNQLNTLKISNGNNTNLTLLATANNIASICVDNVVYANTNFFNNVDEDVVFTDDCSNNTLIQVSPKIYLQGAFTNPNIGEETLMRNDLPISGHLPNISPYEDVLRSEIGLSGNDATVDWVWVELRSALDDSVVFGKSALLQRDGDIFDARSGETLRLLAPNEGDYYVVIKHRNHLSIKASNATSLISFPTTVIDFTSNSSNVLGGLNAVVNINGIYCMYAGDFDNNSQIQTTDVNSVVQLLGSSSYSNADMDMNGQIQNTDINNFITPNIGKGQQF